MLLRLSSRSALMDLNVGEGVIPAQKDHAAEYLVVPGLFNSERALRASLATLPEPVERGLGRTVDLLPGFAERATTVLERRTMKSPRRCEPH
jgi:hypothetical protein